MHLAAIAIVDGNHFVEIVDQIRYNNYSLSSELLRVKSQRDKTTGRVDWFYDNISGINKCCSIELDRVGAEVDIYFFHEVEC